MRKAILFAAAVLLALAACRRAPVHTLEVVSVPVQKIPLNPNDSLWRDLPEYLAKLLPQDLVEPRLMKPSTAEVRVTSATGGSQIAFRIEWLDPVVNDLPGAGRFLDGCAVQIPRKIQPIPPEPQMGQASQPVDIVFWRADWQASVNGRPDTVKSLFPNAAVDHYPFEAKSLEPGSPAQKEMAQRYAPAQASGNRRVGPREFPVEDLVSEGAGTLTPLAGGASRGQGVRTKDGWAVVLVRKMPEGLAPKARTQIAFAVWEGSAHEAGARKMRTGWVPLAVKETK